MDTDWDAIHAGRQPDDVSWWQEPDQLWLDLLDRVDVAAGDHVVDVGAGSSLFCAAVLARGLHQVTALDLSATALARLRAALGPDGARVRTVVGDVRTFVPEAPVALWHDRAVFHFLTDPADQAAYRTALHAALRPDGSAIIATFAPDGPAACSGLPVRRYAPAELAEALGFGPGDVRHAERRVHRTPWGSTQPFTVVVLAKAQGGPARGQMNSS
jgi:trans-aconitate methyltransferase